MNGERKSTENKISLSSIIGYLLLVPPVVSIFLFLVYLLDPRKIKLMITLWSGNNALYFGLMAIAGAYLIKDKNND